MKIKQLYSFLFLFILLPSVRRKCTRTVFCTNITYLQRHIANDAICYEQLLCTVISTQQNTTLLTSSLAPGISHVGRKHMLDIFSFFTTVFVLLVFSDLVGLVLSMQYRRATVYRLSPSSSVLSCRLYLHSTVSKTCCQHLFLYLFSMWFLSSFSYSSLRCLCTVVLVCHPVITA